MYAQANTSQINVLGVLFIQIFACRGSFTVVERSKFGHILYESSQRSEIKGLHIFCILFHDSANVWNVNAIFFLSNFSTPLILLIVKVFLVFVFGLDHENNRHTCKHFSYLQKWSTWEFTSEHLTTYQCFSFCLKKLKQQTFRWKRAKHKIWIHCWQCRINNSSKCNNCYGPRAFGGSAVFCNKSFLLHYI